MEVYKNGSETRTENTRMVEAMRRKRMKNKIGVPCKSSYGRMREGGQVDQKVLAQE